jgi:hypothetical protein
MRRLLMILWKAFGGSFNPEPLLLVLLFIAVIDVFLPGLDPCELEHIFPLLPSNPSFE